MEKNYWYLSTWFISLLFTLWFLVIPLIVGIFLILRQKKINTVQEDTIKSLLNSKKDWLEQKSAFENFLVAKKVQQEKNQYKLALAEQLALVAVTKSREDELIQREEAIDKKEKVHEEYVRQRQKELKALFLIQQLTKVALSKSKEKELTQREKNLDKKEKEYKKRLYEHQKEQKVISLAQQLAVIAMSRNKEEELTQREKELDKNEKAHEKCLYEHQKELKRTFLAQQLAVIAMSRNKEEELTQREKELDRKEKAHEKCLYEHQKELKRTSLAQQLAVIAMSRNKEEELTQRQNTINKKEKEIEEKLSNLENFIRNRKQRIMAISYKKRLKTTELNRKIQNLRNVLMQLDEQNYYHLFGLYEKRFFLEDSEEYDKSLKLVKEEQKKLVREKRATQYHEIKKPYYLSSTEREENSKLIIRFFNNYSDTLIGKVKSNNVEKIEKDIRKSFYDINQLNEKKAICITEEYLHLKLEQLRLVYEKAKKKKEEADEQRKIKAAKKEEHEAAQELERQLEKLEKEEQHLENAIFQPSSQLNEQEIAAYKKRLQAIQEQKEKVDYRLKNIKVGHVYIISNVGCFGENVYKIGMTRRLEPMARIRELGGASVPFQFDVHAMIFTDDAPALEAALHRAFQNQKINKTNNRKEFFKISLEEIKEVLSLNYNKNIEFNMVAEAQEFYESQAIEKMELELQ